MTSPDAERSRATGIRLWVGIALVPLMDPLWDDPLRGTVGLLSLQWTPTVAFKVRPAPPKPPGAPTTTARLALPPLADSPFGARLAPLEGGARP